MKPTLLILTLLHISSCQDVPPQHCHTCQGDCKTTTVEECPNANDRCYSVVLTDNLESRGCANSSVADVICSQIPALSCYTCERDKCNDVGHLGVKKCFVCLDQCETPLAYHDCSEVLMEKEGRPSKAACLRFSVEKETGVEESRGCVRDDPVISGTCLMLNLQKGVSCQICKEDLCNGETGGEVEEGVQECYYCENDCEKPLKKQNCTEELGGGVRSRCLAVDAVIDGKNVELRKCIEDNNQTTSYCDLINLSGGNCTLCDTELCNDIDEEEVEEGVQECYYCDNDCEKPLKKQNCTAELGGGVKSRCLAVDAVIDGKNVELRKCIEDNNQTTSYCDLINLSGGNCTLCDTELCNDIDEEEVEEGVQECYYCDNDCEKPLKKQNCTVELEGVKSRCLAVDAVIDGKNVELRGCIEDNDQTTSYCNMINDSGGNCTLCDTNLCNDISDGQELYPLVSLLLASFVALVSM